MSKVDQYIEDLMRVEGGYVDHPNDRGGPTNWGITQATARAFGYHGRIQDMPRSVAAQIYRQRYWESPRFDHVANLNPAIAQELLDTGVNMGPAVASKFLQRALNVLNQDAKIYPDIVADGVIGPMTIAALRAYLGHRGKDGETVLLRALNCLQGARYIEIAERDARQESFVHGWFLNRVGC